MACFLILVNDISSRRHRYETTLESSSCILVNDTSSQCSTSYDLWATVLMAIRKVWFQLKPPISSLTETAPGFGCSLIPFWTCLGFHCLLFAVQHSGSDYRSFHRVMKTQWLHV